LRPDKSSNAIVREVVEIDKSKGLNNRTARVTLSGAPYFLAKQAILLWKAVI
jgi:hypothetical protein